MNVRYCTVIGQDVHLRHGSACAEKMTERNTEMARSVPVDASTEKPALDSVEELMANANSNTEWETVTEEVPTRVVFDTVGDVFIGDYVGREDIPAEKNPTKDHPEGEAFSLFLFRGLDGKLYSVNTSTRLNDAMSKVDAGRRCRLAYMKDVPVNGQPSPMKDITVSVAKQQ